MSVLFEPAAAIAAAICIAARTLEVTTRHPRRCAWCDWPLDELERMVDGFNAWAGYDERRGTYRQFDASAFQGLPRTEQQRLVAEAQALQPDPPLPTDAVEEGPSWLRQR